MRTDLDRENKPPNEVKHTPQSSEFFSEDSHEKKFLLHVNCKEDHISHKILLNREYFYTDITSQLSILRDQLT